MSTHACFQGNLGVFASFCLYALTGASPLYAFDGRRFAEDGAAMDVVTLATLTGPGGKGSSLEGKGLDGKG